MSGFKQIQKMCCPNIKITLENLVDVRHTSHVLTLRDVLLPSGASIKAFIPEPFSKPAGCQASIHPPLEDKAPVWWLQCLVLRFPKRRTTESDAKRRNILESFPLFCVCITCALADPHKTLRAEAICSSGSEAKAWNSVRRVKREWVVAAGGDVKNNV